MYAYPRYGLTLTGSYGLSTAFSWEGFDTSVGGSWLDPSGTAQGPGWLMQNVEDESRRVDAAKAHLR